MNLGLQEYFTRHPYKVVIRDDVYDIGKRLREVDSSYFVVYDTFKEKYEVHSTDTQGATSYCFTVPFNELDARTITYAMETNVKLRGDKIIEEMEKNNEKIEKENDRKRKNLIEDIGREVWERHDENRLY